VNKIDIPLLADGEEHFNIPGPRDEMKLFLRRLGATGAPLGRSVLYVHGATFPSALSIAYRFGERSWRDALCEAGFDVWGLDFYGFGHSDRYPEMASDAASDAPPLCSAADASHQLKSAVDFILAHEALGSISVISHSWGSMSVGLLAAEHPTMMDRWVLFAPLAQRSARRYENPPAFPAWRLVSVEDQWARFTEDLPSNEDPVFSAAEFEGWAQAYLDSDPHSRTRTPPAVATPCGPISEILRAWHGELSYHPAAVAIPACIIRGEWDGLVTDVDSRWLFDALARSPDKRDIKISKGTHLMHLEKMRWALWQESIAFLQGPPASTPKS
jgi:pimeloyl-ACP methyl ester carboxylesterase